MGCDTCQLVCAVDTSSLEIVTGLSRVGPGAAQFSCVPATWHAEVSLAPIVYTLDQTWDDGPERLDPPEVRVGPQA